ncbi:MAG: MFS transporter [Candidatus Nanoarchaeia archaeon]
MYLEKKLERKLAIFTGVFKATIISALVIFALGIYDFILPIFTESQSENYLFVGLVVSLVYVASFLAEIPVGLSVDKFGRVKILLISIFSLSILTLAYFFFSENIIILAILSLIFGALSVAFWVPSAVLIRDFSPRKMLAQAEGIYLTASQLGWIFGPILGGIVAAQISEKFNFLIMFIFLIAAALFTLFLFGRSEKVKAIRAEEKGHKHKPRLLLLFTIFKEFVQLHRHTKHIYLLCFLTHFWLAIEWAFVPLASMELWHFNETGAGILLGTMMVGEGLLYYSSSYIMDKIGKKYIVTSGFLLLFAAAYFMFLANSWKMFVFFAILAGAAVAWILPGIEAMLTEILPENIYGEMSGVFDTSKDFGLLTGPLIGGLFANKFGVSSTLLLVTFLAGFGALWAGLVFWPGKKQAKIMQKSKA